MSEYLVGSTITDLFVVRDASINTASNGSPYLQLKLFNGSTEIPAKKWNYNGQIPAANTVIQVTAQVRLFRDQIQFNISEWDLPKPGEYDPSKFIPVCPIDKDTLVEEFLDLKFLVSDTYFNDILNAFIIDHLFVEFTVAPGAQGIHHAYLHGLLEHSVGTTQKALYMAEYATNRDLLITGGLLHDIGKIYEYDWSGCTITRTPAGKLMGHILMGMMMLDRLVIEHGVSKDPEKYMLLSHLIASHHGRLEWGSPVEPQTREAVILHTADMLDFQFNAIDKAYAETPASNEFTVGALGIGRQFYKGGN